MNESMEELQKRLEAATSLSSPGPGRPTPDTPQTDSELREWQEAWKTLGRLLDLAEQTLPEPTWKLPPESGDRPRPQSWGAPFRTFHRISGIGRRVGWVVVAVGILGFIGGGMLIWGIGRKGKDEANPASMIAQPSQPVSQPSGGAMVSANRPKGSADQTGSTEGPSHLGHSAGGMPLAATTPTPTPGPTSPSVGQEKFPWDDQWEEAILSIRQASMEIEGRGVYQNDPFIGIRQKIQEIQNELEEGML